MSSHTFHRPSFKPSYGAGCMVLHRSSAKVLLGFRSPTAPQPSRWGTFGGKAEEQDTSIKATALRETREETGHMMEGELTHLYQMGKEPAFVFHTYLAITEKQFTPMLTDETDEARWMYLEEIPSNLHDGLQQLLESPTTVQNLIKFVGHNSGRWSEFEDVYRGSPELARRARAIA